MRCKIVGEVVPRLFCALLPSSCLHLLHCKNNIVHSITDYCSLNGRIIYDTIKTTFAFSLFSYLVQSDFLHIRDRNCCRIDWIYKIAGLGEKFSKNLLIYVVNKHVEILRHCKSMFYIINTLNKTNIALKLNHSESENVSHIFGSYLSFETFRGPCLYLTEALFREVIRKHRYHPYN
jgi:hypothetical protein